MDLKDLDHTDIVVALLLLLSHLDVNLLNLCPVSLFALEQTNESRNLVLDLSWRQTDKEGVGWGVGKRHSNDRSRQARTRGRTFWSCSARWANLTTVYAPLSLRCCRPPRAGFQPPHQTTKKSVLGKRQYLTASERKKCRIKKKKRQTHSCRAAGEFRCMSVGGRRRARAAFPAAGTGAGRAACPSPVSTQPERVIKAR